MHPPPAPTRANFTFMTECTPESSGCYSVYSVAGTMVRLLCVILLEMVDGIFMMYSKCTQENGGGGGGKMRTNRAGIFKKSMGARQCRNRVIVPARQAT